METTILELKGIVKSFPGVLALDGIDFELKSGEVHAICGETGAGKSTLMKVVCGVHKQDKGTMKVNGKEADFQNPLEAYHSGVAIIFQETSLFEEMKIVEHVQEISPYLDEKLDELIRETGFPGSRRGMGLMQA